MASVNMMSQKNNADPRYFIWTIVFLVVAGISLVSYIVLSDSGADYGEIVHAKNAAHKTTAK